MTQASTWMPTLHTQPLSDDFITDGDKLLKVIDIAWKGTDKEPFELDDWQRWLVRHVLERYPADHPTYPGQLRYKEVVVSMGRQNGKSVLAAVFGLYALLMHVGGPEVISVASSVKQANIVYERVRQVIHQNPFLTKRYKATGTRGIRLKDPSQLGSYEVQTGKEEALQGVTISFCLFDEVHICKPSTWNAVQFGTSAVKNSMVLGITTAGDSKSDLLLSLYERGRLAAAGNDDERFGFFLWEAPDHLAIDDPEALIAANPAIACGRVDLEQEIIKVRNMPENSAKRYRLNQFVSSATSWLPMGKWLTLDTSPLPHWHDVVFAVDRTENWTAATITAAVKHEGSIYTQVIASVPNPNIEWLEQMCVELQERFSPLSFVMEQAVLADLNARLRERGIKTEYLTQRQLQNASATVYSLVTEGRLVHAGDPLLVQQVPRGVAKNSGEGWRVSRKDSVGDADALLSMIQAVYAAETMKPNGPDLFILPAA